MYTRKLHGRASASVVVMAVVLVLVVVMVMVVGVVVVLVVLVSGGDHDYRDSGKARLGKRVRSGSGRVSGDI